MRIKNRHKLYMILVWIMVAVGVYWYVAWKPNQIHVEKEIKAEAEEQIQETKNVLEKDTDIRVLIRSANYESLYHQELTISSEAGLICEVGQQCYECTPQQKIVLSAEQLQNRKAVIRTKQEGMICLDNVTRNEKIQYRGIMECYGTNEGIILVNELPVEEYLYGVVPSEMPSSYPEEALKAQAICARTYAYYHKENYAYPEWSVHVDDSTTYQVYNNISETEAAKKAIDATQGQVLVSNGELIESFYYATSSGYSSGYEVWGTKEQKAYLQTKALTMSEDVVETMSQKKNSFAIDETSYCKYIDQGKETDVEYRESWYRWNYDTSVEGNKLLQKAYDMAKAQPEHIFITAKKQGSNQTIVEEEGIEKIQITQRLESGLAQEVKIETSNYEVLVQTQYTIRQLFAQSGEAVTRQDGTEYVLGELLPSAYFYLICNYKDNYVERLEIHGGGFGHGVGMSQNGAKCLAQNGADAEEILQFYYQGVQLLQVGA